MHEVRIGCRDFPERAVPLAPPDGRVLIQPPFHDGPEVPPFSPGFPGQVTQREKRVSVVRRDRSVVGPCPTKHVDVAAECEAFSNVAMRRWQIWAYSDGRSRRDPRAGRARRHTQGGLSVLARVARASPNAPAIRGTEVRKRTT